MSTDYDVTHSVYSRAGDQGYLISIFQTFERNNQRAREVSGQLLMDCVGNTKLNGKQLLIEPKFFKNKNAMLDIKGAKRP
jgi:hypothetical protein